jgi:hypothetical protein
MASLLPRALEEHLSGSRDGRPRFLAMSTSCFFNQNGKCWIWRLGAKITRIVSLYQARLRNAWQYTSHSGGDMSHQSESTASPLLPLNP